MSDDKRAAFSTLYEVLKKISQLMAPYTPFITEDIYTSLVGESVHLSDYPKTEADLINEQLEADMDAVLQIIEQTRSLRNTAGIKTKQPLASLIIIPTDASSTIDLENYVSIIKDEMNIKEVTFKKDYEGLMELDFKLNFATAGPHLGKAIGEVKEMLVDLTDKAKGEFLANDEISLELKTGETITLRTDDVIIEKKGRDGFELLEGKNFITLLGTNLTKALMEEGLVREFVRAVQTYRKELNLPVELRVELFVEADKKFQRVLNEYNDLVQENLILHGLYFERKADMKKFDIEENDVFLHIS